MTTDTKTTPAKEFVFTISRVFDAPHDLVWQVWTRPEHMKHWWGPKGFTVRSCKIDLKPGGLFLYCLEAPDGSEMWGRFLFREIVAPERLVYINSFSDPAGGITLHPGHEGWPRQIHSTVTFTEKGAKTTVDVRWTPYEATESEHKVFQDGAASMQQGWTGTLDQLTAYLADAVKGSTG